MIPDAEGPPGLTALLDPGERVLWTGRPEISGLVPPLTFVGLVALEAGVLALAAWALFEGEWLRAVLALVVSQIPTAYVLWQARVPSRRLHVLTDRRVLTLEAGRLIAQDTPVTMPVVELRPRGPRHGDIVFRWKVERREKGGTTRTPEGLFGLPDAAAVAERLRAWRGERMAAAVETVRGFLAAARDGGAPAIEASGHGRAFVAGHLGLALTVPADWRVEVARVAAGGMVRPAPEWQAPAQAAPGWNAIGIRAVAAAAAIEITVGEGPPDRTFEEVRDDPWARRLGLATLAAEPQVRVGPWRGFSVAHSLNGMQLFGIALPELPVQQRQVWLDAPPRHIHVLMAAEEGAVDLHHVLDAMLASLRPA